MAVIIIDKCSCHSQRFYPCQISRRSYFHNCFYSYVTQIGCCVNVLKVECLLRLTVQ